MILWLKKAIIMFSAYFTGLQSSGEVWVNPQSEVGTTVKITQKYDHLFDKYGGAIPVPFLRALAYSESRMNPDSELDKGIDVKTRKLPSGKYDRYWGLLQVDAKPGGYLKGFNERHGTSITRAQLFDAETNIMVASEKLNRNLKAYKQWGKKHNIANLLPDWDNPEFVKLFVAGWNSGHSRSSGVQFMAAWLKKKGLPVTHDNVFKYGKRAGAASTVTAVRNDKRNWQRGVYRHYTRQRKVAPRLVLKGGAGGVLAALAAVTTLLLVKG